MSLTASDRDLVAVGTSRIGQIDLADGPSERVVKTARTAKMSLLSRLSSVEDK